MKANQATHSIGMMCRLLKVSRSGFYAWCERPMNARAQTDLWLSGKIEAIHRRSRGVYGSPMIHAELADDHGIRTVVDDTPPHIWQGAGACAAWMDAYESWAKSNDVTGVFEVISKVRHIDINGDFAYVVQSVGLSWNEKSKPMSEKAIETVTLKRTPAGWRITGWAWALECLGESYDAPDANAGGSCCSIQPDFTRLDQSWSL